MTDWPTNAFCASHPTSDFWTEPEFAGFGVHYCRRHCPVVDICHKQQMDDPNAGVYAGIHYVRIGVPRKSRPEGKNPLPEVFYFDQLERRKLEIKPARPQPKEIKCFDCASSARNAPVATAATAKVAPGATAFTAVSVNGSRND